MLSWSFWRVLELRRSGAGVCWVPRELQYLWRQPDLQLVSREARGVQQAQHLFCQDKSPTFLPVMSFFSWPICFNLTRALDGIYSCIHFCWGWPVKRFDSETQAQNARMLHTWHQQSNATVWELSDSCWGGISAYPTQCHQQLSGKWQAEASCYSLQALDITRITRTSEIP